MDKGTAQNTHSWLKQIWQRVLPAFYLKALGTTLFMSVFFTAYINLLKNPLFPVQQMPLTALDHLIDFFPPAIILYVSLWLYVSLPPALFTSRRALVAYGFDVAMVCLAGLLCFLVVPTAVPPANIDWNLYPGMGFLKGVDAAGNACPSLHVATAVFSALWLDCHLRQMSWQRLSRVINGLWCAGICYSTLAIKQHVALDLLAGCVLGAGGAWLSMRRAVYQQEGVTARAG